MVGYVVDMVHLCGEGEGGGRGRCVLFSKGGKEGRGFQNLVRGEGMGFQNYWEQTC